MSADNGVRLCGVSDQLGQGDSCRWPDGDISWTIVSVIPGFTFERMKEVAETAFSRLAAVCGIVPRYTDTARNARILINAASLDGPSGVLADSMLPCGNVTQCRQRYDTGERWVVDDGPASGKIDLTRVLAHELEHALGLGHAPAGITALISPTYSQTVIAPLDYDVQQLQRRYGPPKQKPTTPTNTGGTTMGGLKGLLDLITKIGPLLDLLQDPAFMQLLDKIVKLFGNKQALTADDLEALKAELDSDIQQMRA